MNERTDSSYATSYRTFSQIPSVAIEKYSHCQITLKIVKFLLKQTINWFSFIPKPNWRMGKYNT